MILLLLMLTQMAAGERFTCKNPIDQSTMTRCAFKDYHAADRAMNLQWAKALARRRYLDKSNVFPGYPLPSYEQALVKAQRAWIAYRDAQCEVEGQEMRGGSGEPEIVGRCLARITRERTAYLEKVGRD